MTLDKGKVVYQIYPKSYKDTTENGIGDFRGIIEKIPYLAKLGVDMVWLNPFYPSPQRDNGYDISDYMAVDPLFGDMADFEEMVCVGKEHKIDFMLDMVLNHCSTEHEWFQKALAGDKYYQDFFFIQDQPTDWQSKFGGSAWAPFGDTGKYYLHLFDETQADLNWRNSNVRKELFKVVNFWRDKGVKGFRFDVINLIGKDEVSVDCPENEGKPAYTDKPIVHNYLRMMNQATFGSDDSFMTVGEMSSTTMENCVLYSSPDRQELSMTFNFHHLKVDYKDGQKWTLAPFDFEELKSLYHSWGKEMSDKDGWSALFWNNHDQPRALNRFVDIQNFRKEGATMLAASIHLSRGTPYIYMGEEIGMIDPDYDSMADYVDVESLNAYQMLLEEGKSQQEAFQIIQAKSRDNSRIPMQWDASENAGFSTGTPWLKAGKSYKYINVENEIQGPIFTFYQDLIRLRKEMPIISEGSYKPAFEDSKQVYAFERQFEDQKLLVLNNFYAKEVEIDLPAVYQNGQILISNYEDAEVSEKILLKPYQTLAIYVN
ncbi:TPA: alpha,alpha-phosphotrehalase [Streptococcus pneumoniae]|uniref:Alpha,alpha-phosphotrehalase n=2 Tax=Streptococcus pneumoniae TaxID=1313 RepID=A0AAI9ETN4_STREE|nr:alpha,alpha-phosphotrehalase [Streptococcus pneumoniae]EHD48519.1 alpha,alpha-phosphotrehalase [Streptococcus pneumoniae GA16531]EHD73130.1 alpha,alpha-phosphotrehalase [Streptococcus pneumoniae GA44194]EHE09126.1 alpha,alpha-phosphotrehalase [Streptococcus pneumoniae GA17371]EHE22006.1 alpha,alpha-phosphotrehalase [Streptococcus pneumoniae GA41565]EHE75842.1 alpha,alpha-phosphotrehalase [Streptococcus pneumoniae GA11663]EOB16823.1 alpha,alpha-phosphotrehalase [Streptococcus pneumoniae 801